MDQSNNKIQFSCPLRNMGKIPDLNMISGYKTCSHIVNILYTYTFSTHIPLFRVPHSFEGMCQYLEGSVCTWLGCFVRVYQDGLLSVRLLDV